MFVGIGDVIVFPEYSTKFWCPFYTKDGALHALIIYRKRVSDEVVAPNHAPRLIAKDSDALRIRVKS